MGGVPRNPAPRNHFLSTGGSLRTKRSSDAMSLSCDIMLLMLMILILKQIVINNSNDNNNSSSSSSSKNNEVVIVIVAVAATLVPVPVPPAARATEAADSSSFLFVLTVCIYVCTIRYYSIVSVRDLTIRTWSMAMLSKKNQRSCRIIGAQRRQRSVSIISIFEFSV